MAKLRETIAEGESALRDLGALLAAEQQRLSQVFVGRREAFLKQTQMIAQKELAERLSSMAHRLRSRFRYAEVLDLALLNQVLHGSRHVFDRNLRVVHTVLIVEIDRIHPEPLERAFDRLLDVLRTAVQPPCAYCTGAALGPPAGAFGYITWTDMWGSRV